MAILKVGDRGPEVQRLQELLVREGFLRIVPNGIFEDATEKAVYDFQATHIGPDKKYLSTDGIVGPNTWWAIENPSGSNQRNNFDPIIPKGLTPIRQKVLEIATHEYRSNIHEDPDGSNTGDGVTKYLPGFPAQWCDCFINWVFKQATGKYPFGEHLEMSTWNSWQYSEKKGIYFKKETYTPYPGDFMLIQHKNAAGKWTHTGHIGIVSNVSANRKEGFCTISGNEGNRVKLGHRYYTQQNIIGFINPYGSTENCPDFEKGLVTAQDISNIQTT
jgi:hypothetical protein